MTKVTLTPAELSNIIQDAFHLGKVYAADELASAGIDVPTQKGGEWLQQKEFQIRWNKGIEAKGGTPLNSDDAQLDILWEACAMTMKESLKKAIGS